MRVVTGAVIALFAGMPLTGCGDQHETRCFFWPETPMTIGCGMTPGVVTCDTIGGPSCPTAKDAKGRLLDLCSEEGTVDRGPEQRGSDCCYEVSFHDANGECKLN